MAFIRGFLCFVCIFLMWFIDDIIMKSEKDETKKFGFCFLSLIGCIFAMFFILLFV